MKMRNDWWQELPTLLEFEDILAAVLVVTDQLFSLTGAGDGEGVLVLVGDAALALVAIHSDVAPDTSVCTMAGDIEYLLLRSLFFDGLTVGGGHWNGFLGDDFGFGFRLGFGLWFDHDRVQNGFIVVLRLVAADKQKWRNRHRNE